MPVHNPATARREPPSGPVRLADLIRDGKLLWAYFRDCGHERDLEPASLALSGDEPVLTLGLRFRCTQCGGRHITTAPELYPGGVTAAR